MLRQVDHLLDEMQNEVAEMFARYEAQVDQVSGKGLKAEDGPDGFCVTFCVPRRNGANVAVYYERDDDGMYLMRFADLPASDPRSTIGSGKNLTELLALPADAVG